MARPFPDRACCEVPSHWSCVRVLVVDDHCTYRWLLGSLLEQLGVAYRCCNDGQMALAAMEVERFDLVISDCLMPVLDGYAMTRELRRREQAQGLAPVIVLALTANLGAQDIRQCRACGMDGWLTKPIGFAQLREQLRYWLPPPKPFAKARKTAGARTVRNGAFPSRGNLIDTFGTWDVVESMLFSLIQEAHADLAVLHHAQATLDAGQAAQCLHRLVGSVAFLGETGLERDAVALIRVVQVCGVGGNLLALEEFRQDVERYLEYLAQL